MKKIFSIILFTGIASLVFVACKKNNLVIDKEVVPPSFAKFNVRQTSDTAATYYITSTQEKYVIPVSVTTVSNQDRTIQLCYTSTSAVAGTQYTAPATVTIPAGQTTANLEIQGMYAGYPSSSQIDALYIKICGGDVPTSSYWSQFKLTMRKYCDVFLDQLAGDYNNVVDNGSYGPYYMSVTAGTTSGKKGYVTVDNLWDPGVPVSTRVDLDWTNPAAFTATIPDQEFYGAANWWIVGTTPGTFSSCDQSFTLRYKLYNKATGATLYNNQVTVLKR